MNNSTINFNKYRVTPAKRKLLIDIHDWISPHTQYDDAHIICSMIDKILTLGCYDDRERNRLNSVRTDYLQQLKYNE